MRSVADEANLTKSTVHYYLRDADELVDYDGNVIHVVTLDDLVKSWEAPA